MAFSSTAVLLTWHSPSKDNGLQNKRNFSVREYVACTLRLWLRVWLFSPVPSQETTEKGPVNVLADDLTLRISVVFLIGLYLRAKIVQYLEILGWNLGRSQVGGKIGRFKNWPTKTDLLSMWLQEKNTYNFKLFWPFPTIVVFWEVFTEMVTRRQCHFHHWINYNFVLS